MSNNVSPLFNRGFTFYGDKTPPTTPSQSVGVEGTVKEFNFLAPATTGVKTPVDNEKVTCRIVRNASGINLTPGRAVVFQAGYHNRRVDGYARLDFVYAAGIVDDKLPAAGVPNGDLFWLVQKGPCLVKSSLGADATNVINENDIICALTAATSQATTAGRIQAFAATSNATNAISAVLNKIGRALSAKTTGNTNADTLVDLDLMK